MDKLEDGKTKVVVVDSSLANQSLSLNSGEVLKVGCDQNHDSKYVAAMNVPRWNPIQGQHIRHNLIFGDDSDDVNGDVGDDGGDDGGDGGNANCDDGGYVDDYGDDDGDVGDDDANEFHFKDDVSGLRVFSIRHILSQV